MSKSIAYILNNTGAVTDLLSGKVSTTFQPQGNNMPHLVVQENYREPQTTMTSGNTVDRVYFTVTATSTLEDSHGSTIGARDILEQVRQALESTAAGTYATEIISGIEYEGGYNAVNIGVGHRNVIQCEEDYSMFRKRTAGATTSVPAVLLTQAAYDALGSTDPNTYYLIDNS